MSGLGRQPHLAWPRLLMTCRKRRQARRATTFHRIAEAVAHWQVLVGVPPRCGFDVVWPDVWQIGLARCPPDIAHSGPSYCDIDCVRPDVLQFWPDTASLSGDFSRIWPHVGRKRGPSRQVLHQLSLCTMRVYPEVGQGLPARGSGIF